LQLHEEKNNPENSNNNSIDSSHPMGHSEISAYIRKIKLQVKKKKIEKKNFFLD
jgi:hypothetical protein